MTMVKTSDSHRNKFGALPGQLVLLGLGYYLSARLSLHFALIGGIVTPIWPPTGIALAGLLIWGRRVWPAIAVSALPSTTRWARRR